MIKSTIYIYLVLFLALSVKAYAGNGPHILETDWLETEAGSSGETLGAEVKKLYPRDADGVTVIEILVPDINPDTIDAIEVISRNTNEPIRQKQTPVWIDDYEKDTYGLRLFVKKKPGFEFRLRLIDNEKE